MAQLPELDAPTFIHQHFAFSCMYFWVCIRNDKLFSIWILVRDKESTKILQLLCLMSVIGCIYLLSVFRDTLLILPLDLTWVSNPYILLVTCSRQVLRHHETTCTCTHDVHFENSYLPRAAMCAKSSTNLQSSGRLGHQRPRLKTANFWHFQSWMLQSYYI